jgi:glycyl-tRNA synthetase beta subunit
VCVQALVSNKVRLDLRAAVAMAAAEQPMAVTPELQAQVVTFVTRRLEQLLVDSGVKVEPVKSILVERGWDPYLAALTTNDLQVRKKARLLLFEDKGLTRTRPCRDKPGHAWLFCWHQ